MRPRLIIAVILFLLGLVWIGQGTGLIGGSAMSNVGLFALLGAGLVVLAIAVALRDGRRSARS